MVFFGCPDTKKPIKQISNTQKGNLSMTHHNTADPSSSSPKKKKGWRMYITPMGSVADVTSLDFIPRPQIKKLSKNTYVVLKTGEVKDVADKNERNKRSLRRIFRELRQTITANFWDLDDKKLFITLTYAENMQDEKRLYKEFDLFMKRLRHYCKPDGHRLEYLVVMEPQGRGAWHAHLLLKSDRELFIHHADMERLWGHGMTRTERFTGIDNIGAYFIAYFKNVEITPENRELYHVDDDDLVEREGKRYIKGERLKHYPDYMQIWRHSRGVVRPKSQQTYKQLVLDEYQQPHLTHKYEIETAGASSDGREAGESETKKITIVNTQHKKK